MLGPSDTRFLETTTQQRPQIVSRSEMSENVRNMGNAQTLQNQARFDFGPKHGEPPTGATDWNYDRL